MRAKLLIHFVPEQQHDSCNKLCHFWVKINWCLLIDRRSESVSRQLYTDSLNSHAVKHTITALHKIPSKLLFSTSLTLSSLSAPAARGQSSASTDTFVTLFFRFHARLFVFGWTILHKSSRTEASVLCGDRHCPLAEQMLHKSLQYSSLAVLRRVRCV